MKQHGWRAWAAKKYKAITNSNHKLPVSPNLSLSAAFAFSPRRNPFDANNPSPQFSN